MTAYAADAIVVGAGLAGLVAAAELADAGRRVLVVEQEGGGVRGAVLAPAPAPRGVTSTRAVAGEFAFRAGAVVVASGGIDGDHALVRRNWPERLGPPPARMTAGVPAHGDGRMIGIAEAAGARLVNPDRMWHDVEGIENWDPVWPNHGIRILPRPSSLWLDARRADASPSRSSRASLRSARSPSSPTRSARTCSWSRSAARATPWETG